MTDKERPDRDDDDGRTAYERFADLTKRLVSVPKREINERRKAHDRRKARKRA